MTKSETKKVEPSPLEEILGGQLSDVYKTTITDDKGNMDNSAVCMTLLNRIIHR